MGFVATQRATIGRLRLRGTSKYANRELRQRHYALCKAPALFFQTSFEKIVRGLGDHPPRKNKNLFLFYAPV